MASSRNESRAQDKSVNKETGLKSEPSLEELKSTLTSVTSARTNLESLLSLLRLLRRDLETVTENTQLVTSSNRKAMAVLKPKETKRTATK